MIGSGRVPEMWDLGKYQKGRIQASTGNVGSGRVPEIRDLGEYQKRMGSEQVSEKVKSG